MSVLYRSSSEENKRKSRELDNRSAERKMAPKREEDEGACANHDVTTSISAAGDHANYSLFLILKAIFR